MKLIFVPIVILITFSIAFTNEQKNITISSDIELIQINKNFYIHTTWYDFPGFGRAPSNGLIFMKNSKALLVDTPVLNEQTELLYNYLKDSLHVTISKVIVGHSHIDCMGGLSFLHKQDIESISGDKARNICETKNLPLPAKTFKDSLVFKFEGEKIVCRYFGGGHSIDNIVVFFPESKILFGGCLIKSLESKTLGSVKEAIVEEWDTTVMKIKESFPDVQYVIPGHGAYGDSKLLDHTIELVKQHRSRN